MDFRTIAAVNKQKPERHETDIESKSPFHLNETINVTEERTAKMCAGMKKLAKWIKRTRGEELKRKNPPVRVSSLRGGVNV